MARSEPVSRPTVEVTLGFKVPLVEGTQRREAIAAAVSASRAAYAALVTSPHVVEAKITDVEVDPIEGTI